MNLVRTPFPDGRLPLLVVLALVACAPSTETPSPFHAGAAAVAITPAVDADRPPVWIAGYGPGRRATGIHDDLFARAIVVDDGTTRLALVAVDLVGLFLEQTENVRRAVAARREQLGVDRVIVASTHNHESPDSMGLWGPTPGETGFDSRYVRRVEAGVVEAIARAAGSLRGATLAFGESRAPDLVDDGRLPTVIDDRVLVMAVDDASTGEAIATLVNFASHAEIMGRDNTLLTADYPAYLISALETARGGTAAFFPGAIGGLLTPRGIRMPDPRSGNLADEDTWRNAELYGTALADAALEAVASARISRRTVVSLESRPVTLPLDNPRFRQGVAAGIVGGGELSSRFEQHEAGWRMTSEVGLARIGDAQFLLVPGEIYPELVLGGIPDPAVFGADFPEAPVDRPLLPRMTGSLNFVLGLANDEIGYLIPRRQWDEQPPYAYGLDRPQYGEGNSPGPHAAAAVSEALHALLDSDEVTRTSRVR